MSRQLLTTDCLRQLCMDKRGVDSLHCVLLDCIHGLQSVCDANVHVGTLRRPHGQRVTRLQLRIPRGCTSLKDMTGICS